MALPEKRLRWCLLSSSVISIVSSRCMIVKLALVHLNKLSQFPYFLVFSCIKVKTKSSTLSKLRKVVVKTLLGHINFICSFFQTHATQDMILIHVSIVKLSPLRYLLDYIANGSLFSSGLLRISCSRNHLRTRYSSSSTRLSWLSARFIDVNAHLLIFASSLFMTILITSDAPKELHS